MGSFVSWAHQEDESFSLLWRESEISQIKSDFSLFVPMVCSGGTSVLSWITSRVLYSCHIPGEVWRKVLLLLHDLSFSPKLVVKRISLLFFEPFRNLSVFHMRHFHFSWHHSEEPSLLGYQSGWLIH